MRPISAPKPLCTSHIAILGALLLAALACTTGNEYKGGFEPGEPVDDEQSGDPYVRSDGQARERCEQPELGVECQAEAREMIQRGESLAQAALILDQACEQGRASACYDYALLVWCDAGVVYSPDEVRYAMERAQRHGDPIGAGPYPELLAGSAASAAASGKLDAATRARYQDACALKIASACDTLRSLSAPTTPGGAGQPGGSSAAATATTTAPSLTVLSVSARGGLSTAQARQALAGLAQPLSTCPVNEDGEPVLIVISFEVEPNGAVRRTQVQRDTLRDEATLRCIERATFNLQMPAASASSSVVYVAELRELPAP